MLVNQYFCRNIKATTKMKKNKPISPYLNITINNTIEATTSKASKISRCIFKKYSASPIFWEFRIPNEKPLNPKQNMQP